MTDRTTKALLFAIALGLWVNIVGQWIRPATVKAQDSSDVSDIASDVHKIARGSCANSKIC
jgi:hypothetical protein